MRQHNSHDGVRAGAAGEKRVQSAADRASHAGAHREGPPRHTLASSPLRSTMRLRSATVCASTHVARADGQAAKTSASAAPLLTKSARHQRARRRSPLHIHVAACIVACVARPGGGSGLSACRGEAGAAGQRLGSRLRPTKGLSSLARDTACRSHAQPERASRGCGAAGTLGAGRQRARGAAKRRAARSRSSRSEDTPTVYGHRCRCTRGACSALSCCEGQVDRGSDASGRWRGASLASSNLAANAREPRVERELFEAGAPPLHRRERPVCCWRGGQFTAPCARDRRHQTQTWRQLHAGLWRECEELRAAGPRSPWGHPCKTGATSALSPRSLVRATQPW